MVAGISDAYWGQIERGHQVAKGVYRVIHPSRAMLLQVSEALRLTTRDTNRLLEMAGHRPVAAGDSAPARADDVDLTGLARRDIRLLQLIAERLREESAVGEQDTGPGLRAVARRPRDKKEP